MYTVKLAKRAGSEDSLLNFAVSGEPPQKRAPEKGEKPEEAERRNKEFAASRKRLEDRVAAERALAKWTFVVERREIEPLLMSRGDMMPPRRDKN